MNEFLKTYIEKTIEEQRRSNADIINMLNAQYVIQEKMIKMYEEMVELLKKETT